MVESFERKRCGNICIAMKRENWGLKVDKKCHICVQLLKYIVVSYAATKSHVSLIDLVSAGVYVNVHGKCTTKGYENMNNLGLPGIMLMSQI